MTPHALRALRRVMSPPVLMNSLAVMVVVGTLLNAINQGDALVAGKALDWSKVILTYFMPFGVASFASWRVLMGEG